VERCHGSPPVFGSWLAARSIAKGTPDRDASAGGVLLPNAASLAGAGRASRRVRVRSERAQRRGARAAAGVAAGLLTAAPALASEGNIVLVPTPEMLLSLIALFVLLVFPVNALLLKPIFRALDARDEKIEGTRRRASQLAAEADRILADYEGRIREVREEAELERRERLAEARAQSLGEASAARGAAEGEIERARGEIAGELERARAGLRSEAVALAREVAGSVLGRPLS
jgi:F-type H+-transporting ATPase subunit b